MGMLAIADFCEREGLSTQIINVPMEQCFDPTWSLENFLRGIDFKICGIDLHWSLHSNGAMEVAKIVKKVNPNAKVILGGFTATYYYDEILKYYNAVDGVIRGEGEVPFLNYAQNVIRDRSVEAVPNLSYRASNQQIKINPVSYVAKTLDDLDFTNISLMHHGKEYLEQSRHIMAMPFNLAIARGCPYQCPLCGGGRESQLLLNKRQKVLFRSPERVIEDLSKIFDNYNPDGVYFGHGTYPSNLPYWKTLFKLIRKEKFDMCADLEIWRCPFPKEMWYEFYKTFRRKNSSISICPRTLSTRVQQKVAQVCDPTFQFPPNQIKDLIKNANLFRMVLRIWLTIGFPFQTLSDLIYDYLYTIKLSFQHGSSHFRPITIMTDMVYVSPASPAFEHPERYDLKLTFKTFRQAVDLYRRTKFSIGGWNTVTNYRTNQFSSPAIRMWNLLFLITEIPMFLSSFPRDPIQKEAEAKKLEQKKLFESLNNDKSHQN
jgi:hypothetical protein